MKRTRFFGVSGSQVGMKATIDLFHFTNERHIRSSFESALLNVISCI